MSFPDPIYEFGALRVPGQQHLPHVRSFFPGHTFVGCDMSDGPGVDRVEDLHALSVPDGSVGTALLFDTIEHVRNPWQAMAELRRVLKPGGFVVMTSVWYFPIHAYPDDYWRFTGSGFRTLFQGLEPVSVTMCGLSRLPHTVVGIASKGTLDPSVTRVVDDVVMTWRERDSWTWKETMMEICPPVVLIPAYACYLKSMNAINRALGRNT